MEHVFFARFARRVDAQRVLTEVAALGRHVVVNQVTRAVTESSHDMPSSASNVPAAAVKGLVGGAAGGGLLGLLLATAGVGEMSMTIGLATLFGAIAGALGAILVGTQDPDQNLERAASTLQGDQVLLCVRTDDLSSEERALDMVHDAGGEVLPRAGIKPIDDMAIAADKEGR